MIDIVVGWFNFIFNLKNKEARKKAVYCVSCRFLSFSKYEVIKENSIREISGAVCSACECPLSAKLRSSSKCPINRF